MITKEMLTEWEGTTEELRQVLSSFNQEQINSVPAEGGWSAAQVADHLVKASVAAILYGPVEPTQRLPDQHVQPLKEQFLNFTIPMNSPGFIMPTRSVYSRERLLHTLESISAQIREAILTVDLSVTCLRTPPELGTLTRWELIYFNIYHIQRHLHQLKNIYQQVVN